MLAAFGGVIVLCRILRLLGHFVAEPVSSLKARFQEISRD